MTAGWPVLVARLVASTVLTVLAGLATVSALPTLLGWHSAVVMSGSMRPRIAPGDVVAAAPVRPASLLPGQIVLVHDPVERGRLLMHRFMGRDENGLLVTKGDANSQKDSTPVSPADVVGLPRIRVPYLGLPMLWMHDSDYVRVAALAAILVLAAGLVLQTEGGYEGLHRA